MCWMWQDRLFHHHCLQVLSNYKKTNKKLIFFRKGKLISTVRDRINLSGTGTAPTHLLKFSYTNAFPNHKYSTVTIYYNLKLKKDNNWIFNVCRFMFQSRFCVSSDCDCSAPVLCRFWFWFCAVPVLCRFSDRFILSRTVYIRVV